MYNIWKTDEILGIHRNLHIQTISSFFLNYESQSWTPLTFSSITYWNWIMNISWLASQLLNIDFNDLWLNKMVRPRRLLTEKLLLLKEAKTNKTKRENKLDSKLSTSTFNSLGLSFQVLPFVWDVLCPLC